MGNSTLNNLLKEYEQKKYIADLNFEKDKSAFYNSHPELLEIKNKLGMLAIDISKAVLNNNLELEGKLKSDFKKLEQEKSSLLNSIKIPKRSFRAYL